MYRSLSFLHSWCQVLCADVSVSNAWHHVMMCPRTAHTPPVGLPETSVQRCTSPADHSSNQSAIAGHHRSGWELQNVHFLPHTILLVHSQIVRKLCAGFSINSLSFSQFHTLLFQIENAHKQFLHKSKLVCFFAIFL